MQELLFVVHGGAAQERSKVFRAATGRLADRGLSVGATYATSRVALLVASPTGSTPCLRVHGAGGRAIAWVGHVVAPNMGLWPSAEELLPQLGNDAVAALSRMDGLYAFALSERDGQCISLAADPCGVWPLYYVDDGVILCCSTSLDLLLHAAPGPLTFAPEAAAEFLHFGYCLGDKTLAREIRRVPQGELLTFPRDQGQPRAHKLFDFAQLPAPAPQPLDAAAQSLACAAADAIERRRTPGQATVCLLSGGYDSRLISGLLSRAGVAFTTITTYGDTGALDDPDVARLVAEVLNVQNVYVPLPDDYLERCWRDKCLLTDFASPMHTWLMPLTREHPAPDAVNYDGIGGDVALKGLLLRARDLALLAEGKHSELVDALLTYHAPAPAGGGPLVDELCANWRAAVRASLADALRRWGGHPNSLSFFVLSNRTRRAIGASPALLLQHRLRNLAPLLDWQFLTQALSVPPECKLDGALYKAVIRCVNPRLADLPSSNDKTWPPSFPRRSRPRQCFQSPGGIASYWAEIERALPAFATGLAPAWLKTVADTLHGEPAARRTLLPTVQRIAELAYWLNSCAHNVRIASLLANPQP